MIGNRESIVARLFQDADNLSNSWLFLERDDRLAHNVLCVELAHEQGRFPWGKLIIDLTKSLGRTIEEGGSF